MKKLVVVMLFFVSLGFSQVIQGESSVAFRVAEPDLIPEGIAYSARTQSFYLSSIHQEKRVQVNAGTGELRDFVKPGAHGFLPGMGLWVDDEEGQLGAIGSDVEEGKRGSQIFLVDLEKGDLLKSYGLEDNVKHFFNDLTSHRAGRFYVRDSDNRRSSVFTRGLRVRGVGHGAL